MSRLSMRCIAGSSLLVLAATLPPAVRAADPGDNAGKTDQQQLVGAWKVIGLEISGTPAEAEDLRGLKVVNAADGSWGLWSDTKELQVGRSTLNPSKTPKQIDFTASEPQGQQQQYHGVYEITGDKRQVCFTQIDHPRPTELVSQPGSQWILMTLERVTDD